jgi:hypothetical protein
MRSMWAGSSAARRPARTCAGQRRSRLRSRPIRVIDAWGPNATTSSAPDSTPNSMAAKAPDELPTNTRLDTPSSSSNPVRWAVVAVTPSAVPGSPRWYQHCPRSRTNIRWTPRCSVWRTNSTGGASMPLDNPPKQTMAGTGSAAPGSHGARSTTTAQVPSSKASAMCGGRPSAGVMVGSSSRVGPAGPRIGSVVTRSWAGYLGIRSCDA